MGMIEFFQDHMTYVLFVKICDISNIHIF